MEISDPHVKYASHFAFNKVVAYLGTSPDLIGILYQYGMLHAIYIPNNPEPTEIKELPVALQEAVKIYVGVVTQHNVYIRFYSTVAEITPEKFYPPISLIRLGTTKKPIETEAEIKEYIEDDQEFKNKMSNIRAQNYHIIFQEITRAIKSEKQWVYYCGMTSIIAAFGKTSHDQPLFVQCGLILTPPSLEIANFTPHPASFPLPPSSTVKVNLCHKFTESFAFCR
ncbi:hypothetical protein K1719_033927 [Acacia pycnantha]|nr:hypothetical protein K1719_033927 [Acacia pycnantha]